MSQLQEYVFTAVLTQFFVTLFAFWLVRKLSVTSGDYYTGAVGCALSLTFYFWLKLRGVDRLSRGKP